MFERTRLGRTGRSPDQFATISVVAEVNADGRVVREEVPVEPVDRGRFRALCTPGIAHGFAADDIIEVDAEGTARTRERAGNVGVQIYVAEHDDEEVLRVIEGAEALGGWLDGLDPERLIVLTIPVTAGFAAIEALVEGHAARTRSEWVYSNVYAEDGVSPLEWWVAD
jgi:hypothetical protein